MYFTSLSQFVYPNLIKQNSKVLKFPKRIKTPEQRTIQENPSNSQFSASLNPTIQDHGRLKYCSSLLVSQSTSEFTFVCIAAKTINKWENRDQET